VCSNSMIVFGERFFVRAKLIYSSRPNCAHGLPRLPGSYSHTHAVLQTDTLFYIHCACTAGSTFCFAGVGVGATFNQTWQYYSYRVRKREPESMATLA
jgi:hypothetical protein